MSTLLPHTIVVRRRSGSLVKGVWTPGPVESGTFVGSVQPVKGKDLDLLPIGRRDTGSMKVYSNTPLAVSVEGGDTPGDIVVWQGRQWEVVAELPYQNDLIPHYKYLATDIGEA